MKVLVITQDAEVSKAVSLSFQLGWPEASLLPAAAGADGIVMARRDSPDVVLLDPALPDMDGLDVLPQIRSFSSVPVIVVTGIDEEVKTVRALEFGADDYVVKPLSYLELIARVRAVLRRTRVLHSAAWGPAPDDAGLVIDPTTERVTLHGREVPLTRTEYRLVCLLAENAGRTVARETLLQAVWGEGHLDRPDVLKTSIHRLRRKLGDAPGQPALIDTVPRKGYQLRLPPRQGLPGFRQPAPPGGRALHQDGEASLRTS